MSRIPNSRRDFETMSRNEQVRIYRAARSFAMKNEPGLTAVEFDADMADRASRLIQWSHGAAMVSAALDDYLSAHTTRNHHTSPETEAWSSMEGTFFTTTERHQAAWDSIV